MLWQNGLAGSRPAYEQNRILTNSKLRMLCTVSSTWLENPVNEEMILKLTDLSSLVYAWREISTPEAVAEWLHTVTQKDEIFLHVLLKLRYDGVNSVTGRYKGLRLSAVTELFGEGNYVNERLKNIEKANLFPELVVQIRNAMSYNRND